MHQIAVIKAVKKAYTFVRDIDLSTDLLFYGLFALPRKLFYVGEKGLINKGKFEIGM